MASRRDSRSKLDYFAPPPSPRLGGMESRTIGRLIRSNILAATLIVACCIFAFDSFTHRLGPVSRELTTELARPKQEKTDDVRVMFYVFPQWHPIPENNRNLGWDWVDWRLLHKFRPTLSRSVAKDQWPTTLGEYNQLSRRTRREQAKMLQDHGGYGFVYHTYWFKGNPVMDEPLRHMLNDDIDVPFMLNWANEDWVDRWQAGDSHAMAIIDMKDPKDRRAMFDYYLPFFQDRRYVRVDGKPVFQAYQLSEHMELVFQDFKRWAVEEGLGGLHTIQCLAHFDAKIFTPSDAVNFPQLKVGKYADGISEFWPNLAQTMWIFDNTDARLGSAKMPLQHPTWHWRGLYVDFDHRIRHGLPESPRNHPYLFERHLRVTAEASKQDALANPNIQPGLENHHYILINAWNEWSEGNTMEPSDLYGYGYLEAMQNAIQKDVKDSRVCFIVSASAAPNAFVDLERTLGSLKNLHVDWEALVYSSTPTPEVPVGIMNVIRSSHQARARYVDVPASLQGRHNETSTAVFNYIAPRCHDIESAQFTTFLRAGEAYTRHRQPASWEDSWQFDVTGCEGATASRTAPRIGLLEMDTAAKHAHLQQWKRYKRC